METTTGHRRFLILTLFALTILALTIISGCDSDDVSGLVGPTIGTEVTWTVQDGGAGDNTLNSVYFLNSSMGWAVGGMGTILSYVDSAWTPLTSGVTTSLRGVHFINKNTGFVVGQNGYILSTVNGGADWALDSNYIVCNGGTEKVRTDLNDVFFTDAKHGWVVGDKGAVLSYTIDSACVDSVFTDTPIIIDSTRWDTIIDTIFRDTLFDSTNYWPDSMTVDTILRDTIIAIPDSVRVIDTIMDTIGVDVIPTQSGLFILRDDLGTAANFLHDLWDVFFADTQNGWAVGNRGTVIHTGNAGATWEVQETGTKLPLRGVSFVDPLNGWVVGHDNLILHTTDGGNTWRRQFKDSGLSEHFIAVDFPDAQNGWVVNTKGEVYRTADGGQSWVRDRRGSDKALNAVYFLDATTGWAVGYNGQIIYSKPAE